MDMINIYARKDTPFMNYVAVPIYPEFDALTKNLEKTGRDVIVCALLHYYETNKSDNDSAKNILPPYLYKPYSLYLDFLKLHEQAKALEKRLKEGV